MVEWPVPLLGDFNPDYLDVPQEALISYMQDHQKYFPVVNGDGKLMPRFITVANIESKDPSVVVAGNERVLNARLSDARFFWDTDRKQTLESRVEKLDTILFHKKLGSVLDKVKRVQSIAAAVAQWIGADVDNTRRAALLAKADLVSDMVGEFPELQGIMGRYYAVNDGEADEVAQAIEEQYWPRFAGDHLPETGAGQALAIADKIDSLAGIFSTGELPTGTKDPYGLRRAALGLLRIIIEKRLPIDLRELLRKAGRPFENADSDAVLDYILERLPAYYADEGLDTDTVNAVLSLKPGEPLDIDRRVRAVAAFRELPEAEALAAANKRIRNILKKSDAAIPETVDESLLEEEQEKALFDTMTALKTELEPAFESGDYAAALSGLAALREPVDAFFDAVMVNVDDKKVRANRLALLKQLGDLFLRVADISRLQS
ncbi:MAG: glycine--tRNA ligase subunit beta [Gammaproteobacteria bacterium]|nr:MAG: glycine--tRNA ligase subunit beta [Gammaproteobacteria bacterium]